MYKLAIVDDNPTWCLGLQIALSQQGFRVTTFRDAHSFLSNAGQFQIGLIDYSLPIRRGQPEMDGAALIRSIKTQLDRPPALILISAYFTPELLKQANPLCPDADACMSKSSGLQEIITQLHQFVPEPSIAS